METTKQVSVFLENKPGRLANVLSALAREKINITALTVMDSHEHSVLRVVVNDVAKTVQVLNGLNTPHAQSDVLVVELRNQPGALAHVCELLGAEHINIEYAYCSSGGRNGKTVGVFKVSNTDKAIKILGGPLDVNGRRRLETRPLRDKRTYTNPGGNSR
ncbi:MAG TPA: ACT domain-containing protein [Gemmataceae bacterium]|nr:ACT domain-containing protein [Gemmataceae bacterium]